MAFSRSGDFFRGGLFLDGRVDTLEDQTEGPLLNPVEMGNHSLMDVVSKVRALGYRDQFDIVFGKGALDDDRRAFSFVVAAIVSYERSTELNPFTSKYDVGMNRA